MTNVSLKTSPADFPKLADFAREKEINFLIPGPEAPLVDGIVDFFQQHIPTCLSFGPSKAAARMEGSKAFSKDFMKDHSIPTASYENFSSYEDAKRYLDTVDHDIVIKADGLAAGKGVIIPQTKEEAHTALKEIMVEKKFGAAAGEKVVIEEFMEGEEVSILSFSDGHTIESLPPAQDHKRIGEGDTGPNTGGMGTYAPTQVVTQQQLKEIDQTILQPTIDGMRSSGYTFVGCLFTGLMMTKRGPRVLEYNVRFGDPETQSVLSLLRTDLAELMLACTKGTLSSHKIEIDPGFAATVVVAAGGYPDDYAKGIPMTLSETPANVELFHAGTTLEDSMLKTSGGRVIASTATGTTLKEAVKRAYEGVQCIEFNGMQFRRDIAARAMR